jgi:hypothetical protein
MPHGHDGCDEKCFISNLTSKYNTDRFVEALQKRSTHLGEGLGTQPPVMLQNPSNYRTSAEKGGFASTSAHAVTICALISATHATSLLLMLCCSKRLSDLEQRNVNRHSRYVPPSPALILLSQCMSYTPACAAPMPRPRAVSMRAICKLANRKESGPHATQDYMSSVAQRLRRSNVATLHCATLLASMAECYSVKNMPCGFCRRR